ncbi:hypothetical protein ACHAXA_009081 [Cyclostephanos tholiformis]|uniref:Uncharacterized protein n=1 Tax=Cyclostephanos tholiformis TaxID=382380 RepID=A0ABD3SPX6_9STRA
MTLKRYLTEILSWHGSRSFASIGQKMQQPHIRAISRFARHLLHRNSIVVVVVNDGGRSSSSSASSCGRFPPPRYHRVWHGDIAAMIRRSTSTSTSKSSSCASTAPCVRSIVPTSNPARRRFSSTTTRNVLVSSVDGGSRLPNLDVSVVLSPGRYCKLSSWSSSSWSISGTRSGLDAARRLVEGRRALLDRVRDELTIGGRGDGIGWTIAGEEDAIGNDSARVNGRTYDLTGHGVPVGLLRHLCDSARGWLGITTRGQNRRIRPNVTNPPRDDVNGNDNDDHHDHDDGCRRRYDRISFANVPNSTLLDTDRIGIVGPATVAVSSHLPSLPVEWEHDLEMYMVVMDRIGSRMAALAMTAVVNDYDDGDNDNDIDPRKTAGSIVAPSRLRKWDVTIAGGGHGEASSASSVVRVGDGRDRSGGVSGAHRRGVNAPPPTPTLSLAWAHMTGECWKVVLRLHDCGVVSEGREGGGPRKDSVSLLFEGEYVLQ